MKEKKKKLKKETMKFRLFTIESQIGISTTYRFRSMVNGMVGSWQSESETALVEGFAHQAVMLTIYPRLKKLIKKGVKI